MNTYFTKVVWDLRDATINLQRLASPSVTKSAKDCSRLDLASADNVDAMYYLQVNRLFRGVNMLFRITSTLYTTFRYATDLS